MLTALTAYRASAQTSANIDGIWAGTAQQNGNSVPFQLEIAGTGDDVSGALVNGKQKSPSSSGSYSGGHLVLHFDYFANTLDATLQDGVLTGTFGRTGKFVPITAHLNDVTPPPSPDWAGAGDLLSCVWSSDVAQQQEPRSGLVGAMERGQQQAVLWSINTRRW